MATSWPPFEGRNGLWREDLDDLRVLARPVLRDPGEGSPMAKIIVRWEVESQVSTPEAEVHFYLYREGETSHHDRRTYTRQELVRRAATIAAAEDDVPIYYEQALKAFADDEAP